MKYKVTLNGRTYEVEVEAGKAMLLDEYAAVAPVAAPAAAAAAAPVAAPAAAPAAAPQPQAYAPQPQQPAAPAAAPQPEVAGGAAEDDLPF